MTYNDFVRRCWDGGDEIIHKDSGGDKIKEEAINQCLNHYLDMCEKVEGTWEQRYSLLMAVQKQFEVYLQITNKGESND